MVALLILSSLLSISPDLFAQEDTEFWFALPRMLSGHNNKKSATYQLILFNHNSVAANISISQPANSNDKIKQSFALAANEDKKITLADKNGVYKKTDYISVPYDEVSKCGIYIVSDVPIQCYFQVTKGNGEAFTLKGINALGTDFIVAMQNKFDHGRGGSDDMYDDSYAGVAIVASEDNTEVTISPSKNVSPSCNKSAINVTLNRGETYAFRSCSEKGSDNPIGTKIHSNKSVAVTYNDDCLMNGNNSDAVGEQLAPAILAGNKYVAVSNKTSSDYIFLIGLSDGTTVTDEKGNTYSLNNGEVQQISLSDRAAIYLEGSSPFEVFQVTGYYGGKGCEMGGTVLPQISCTGSTSVSYNCVNAVKESSIKKEDQGVVLNLVTHKDNISSISVNGEPISSSDFHALGTSDFYYFSENLYSKYEIKDTIINVVSTLGVFQMGVLDYDKGNTATFGFFSNYASSATVTINDETTNRYFACKGQPLHVKVTPIDKTVDLADSKVEWRDLLNGGKVREDLKTDVLDIPAVDFDTAAFQVVWMNSCGVSSYINIMIGTKKTEKIETSKLSNGSYTWPVNGVTYSASGDYTFSPSCEQEYILHLTIVPIAEHPFTIAKCGLTATFAHGNMQYKPSTGEWRFADSQITLLGNQNKNIADDYDDWIDLFGWGTGDNPTLKSNNDADYLPGVFDIANSSHDWGANTITNGGGDSWRTLTNDEWLYVMKHRDNADNLWSRACINGQNGLLILPDDWVTPVGVSFTPASETFSTNTYTLDQWAKLEQEGAIFLPAGGWRNPVADQALYQVNKEGYYWSATATDDNRAYELRFAENLLNVDNPYHRYSGSTVRLVKDINTIAYSETKDTSAVACDQFTWDRTGETYTEGGERIYKGETKEGCELTVKLDLTINHSESKDTAAVACDQFTWDRTGETYTDSGEKIYKGKTKDGCELTVKLDLTINHSESKDTTAVACDQFTWDRTGKTYTDSGEKIYKGKTKDGCDLTVKLDLTINHSETKDTSAVACDQFTWDRTGETYTEGGEKIYKGKTKDGCDLTVNLDLTINHSETKDTAAVACDQFTWDRTGKTYTESGKHQYKGKTKDGCDLIVNLDLTINHSETKDTAAVACDQFTWDRTGETYTEGGEKIYNGKTKDGCDLTVKLDLTINSSDSKDTIAAECDQFTWDRTGETYTESGKYQYNGKTAAGCDFIVYLDLTIRKRDTLEYNVSVCPEEPYEWHGNTYYTPGNYQHKEISKLPPYCDSIEILHLSHYKDYKTKFKTIADPVVACDSYTWEGTTYTTSGSYTQTLKTIHGCDSVVTLPLTINYTKRETINREICFGETFTLGKQKCKTTGTYEETFVSYQNCDSIVTLNLTVKPLLTDTLKVMLCPGKSRVVYDVFNGNKPIYVSKAGENKLTLTAADGCDSLLVVNVGLYSNEPVHVYDTICQNQTYYRESTGEVFSDLTVGDHEFSFYPLYSEYNCEYTEVLHLRVNPTYTKNVFDTICQNDVYSWEGSIYNSTTHDTKNLHSIHGCDSIVTLYLQVWPTYNKTDYRVLCEGESFVWGDYNIPSVKPSDSGTYTNVFQTIHGCDSTVMLTLVVNPIYNHSFDVTICDNEVYPWQGDAYKYEGKRDITDTKVLRTIHDCDSVVTMNLHFNPTKSSEFSATICDNETYEWNGKSYNIADDYVQTLTTSLGCDSVVTLHLNVNPTYNIQWADTILNEETLTWEGTTYNEGGAYSKTLVTKNGCDSVVTLNLTKNIFDITEVGHTDICIESDSAGFFTFQVVKGDIDYIQLVFSEELRSQKVKNQKVQVNGSHQSITVEVPMHVRAGVYSMTADYYFRGHKVYTQDVLFNVLYPSSVLLQKWNDFIGVQTYNYNGGYNFTKFEWYKNGQLLVGQTGSYIYQPLEQGAVYNALLTDDRGYKLFTCPLIAVNKDDITLYPTVVRKAGAMKLHTSQPGTLYVYDATGKLVQRHDCESGDTQLSAPSQPGMYVVKVILSDNQTEKTYKVVVQ